MKNLPTLSLPFRHHLNIRFRHTEEYYYVVNRVTPPLKEVKYRLIMHRCNHSCAPCRKENPNVVKAYQKFKGRNFEIIAVSLDKAKAPWLKAIKDDGLSWIHVSDLNYRKNAVAQEYGIHAIPQNLLLDPNGIIIAKNLRGEALEKKLEEVFQ